MDFVDSHVGYYVEFIYLEIKFIQVLTELYIFEFIILENLVEKTLKSAFS